MIDFKDKEVQYHIVFNSNDKYIKYAAVLITNIMKKIDFNKKFFDFKKYDFDLNINENDFKEVFYFHILTDKINKNTKCNLDGFVASLNEDNLYCKVILYEVCENDFLECPKWNNHDNYLCYYKIKIASFLPKHISKCLFLDIDMSVLCDLREIFALDLEDKIAAVTPDCSNAYKNRFVKAINSDEILNFSYIHSYFNVGFMLINLNEWKKYKVEQRAIMFLKKYIPRVPEQDALNFVIGNRIIKIPPKWNFFISHFLHDRCEWNNRFKDESFDYIYDYSYDDYIDSLADIKVIHFTYGVPKPWESLYKDLDTKFCPKFYPYYSEWWLYVEQTYIFGDIIKNEKENDLKMYSLALSRRLGILENRLRHLESILGYYNLDSAYNVMRNEFNYKLGYGIINTYKSPFGIFKLPFIIIKMIYAEYRKNRFVKKIFNSDHFVPIDLKNYDDYEESLFKVQKHLSYIIGKSLLDNPFSFIFKLKGIYSEFKKNKK
ncbi:sugar transferase [Campylobacter jejuni subsp. doylei]|nr:sugar transferase [Campylobacter jejuni subsp. doylei]